MSLFVNAVAGNYSEVTVMEGCCPPRSLPPLLLFAITSAPVGLAPLALYRRPEQNVLLAAFGPFEEEDSAISWL